MLEVARKATEDQIAKMSMTKEQVSQRVLQDGQPLALHKFEWYKNTRVFSTTEDNLVIDFAGKNFVTFKTGSYCIFNIGFDCTFETGSHYIFNTGPFSTFTCQDQCVIVRRDVFEVIQPEPGQIIKLRGFDTPGYNIIKPEPETIEINGKTYRKDEVEERLAELKEVEYD